MDIKTDPEWIRALEREWKAGFEAGMEEADRKNLHIVEELLIKIRKLRDQITELNACGGGTIQ